MNQKMFFASLFSVALVCSLIPGRILAETSADTSASVSVSDGTSSTASGEVVKASDTSGWGLFIRGIRERLSLLTTFDPVAKAEKALKFAEERSKIAEALAGKTDDPQAQERLKQVLERTQKLEDQADHVKDKLLDNPDARAKLLLKNLLNFKEHKEEVFSKLEEKLTPEQLEKLKTLQADAEEKSKALLNALQNAKIPDDVRAHLEEVKAKIEEQQKQVKEFQGAQKALLDRIKSGDESAKEELKTLHEERGAEIRQNLEQGLERREEAKVKLEEKAADHPAAVRKLEEIQKREAIIREKVQRREHVRPILPLREKPQN